MPNFNSLKRVIMVDKAHETQLKNAFQAGIAWQAGSVATRCVYEFVKKTLNDLGITHEDKHIDPADSLPTGKIARYHD